MPKDTLPIGNFVDSIMIGADNTALVADSTNDYKAKFRAMTISDITNLQSSLNAVGGVYNGHVTGVGGTGDAITGTISPARTLAAGDRVSLKAGADNSGATTLALTGATPATAIAIQKKGAACSGGEIDQNGMYMLVYDGTVWQLVCGD